MAALETVLTIDELRYYPIVSGVTTSVYVQCHSSVVFGGGGTFYWHDGYSFTADNDGTVIEPLYPDAPTGRWIRQIEYFIDIRFFGVFGDGASDCRDQIQRAIDHAASDSYALRGNTVYFPDGTYPVKGHLILKSGVSILGDSYQDTFISTLYNEEYEDDPDNKGFLFITDIGRIEGCNISNLSFSGDVRPNRFDFPILPDFRQKGFLFVDATVGPNDDGGMWGCTFKNLRVYNFNGDVLYFMAGTGDNYKLPNQSCIFENISVMRQKENSRALYMEGEHGQMTFINCGFDGLVYNQDTERNRFDVIKGRNVHLIGNGNLGLQPAVISFINSTFQSSEYGVLLEDCQSITFDTCWFETLDMALTTINNRSGHSKGINVLNSRFANASGFGSLHVANRNLPPISPAPFENAGRCITSVNSEVNVYNNFVCVSDIDVSHVEPTDPNNPFYSKAFILALKNDGVRTIGNSFQDSRLGRTVGILQQFQIEPDTIFGGTYVNLKDTKIAFIEGQPEDTNIVQRLDCSINSGEILSLRTANKNPIRLTEEKNIFLSQKGSLQLNYGDIATFVKIDNIGGIYGEIYQLIALFQNTTPVT